MENFDMAQYNGVVKQNRELQKDLRNSIQISWNDANNVNYDEFLLKRYSFITALNTTECIGFIEVEYTYDKHRRIYAGIAKGYDFNADILNIAKYGTCIKDLGYAE